LNLTVQIWLGARPAWGKDRDASVQP